MFAGLRTESRMRKIAASKLIGSAKAASEINVLKSTPSYNIYGKGNGKKGFVIVSTNDNATPVLGYSSTEYIGNQLSDYAVDLRYPDTKYIPTQEETQEVIELMYKIIEIANVLTYHPHRNTNYHK